MLTRPCFRSLTLDHIHASADPTEGMYTKALDPKALDKGGDGILDGLVNMVVLDTEDALGLGAVVAVRPRVDGRDLGRVALGVGRAFRPVVFECLQSEECLWKWCSQERDRWASWDRHRR